MRYILVLLFSIMFVACDSSANKSVQNAESSCELSIFGTRLYITALLEILCPECLVGLNATIKPQDLPFKPPYFKDLPIFGIEQVNMSAEALLNAKPNIIFFSQNALDSTLEPYIKSGIKAIRVPSNEYPHFADMISIVASALEADTICGEKITKRASDLLNFMQEANALLERFDKALQASRIERPKVYIALDSNGLKTQCGDKGYIAHKIGGINAYPCPNNEPFYEPSIDMESLARLNPDIIFIRELSLYNALKQGGLPTWQALNAIKQKRFYYIPQTPNAWLTKPTNALQSVGLVWAYSKVHPNIALDSIAKAHVKRFFELFLAPLDDETYAKIQGL